MRTLWDKFWEKVDFEGPVHPYRGTRCWLWTAAMCHGYGQIVTIGNKHWSAHRLSYEWFIGPIPSGGRVDHRCFNRSCVRPDHLRLATHKQNMENRPALQRNNTSGIQGVWWDSFSRSWRAMVHHHGRKVDCGRFKNPEEAKSAVVIKRNELFTHNDLDRQLVNDK